MPTIIKKIKVKNIIVHCDTATGCKYNKDGYCNVPSGHIYLTKYVSSKGAKLSECVLLTSIRGK